MMRPGTVLIAAFAIGGAYGFAAAKLDLDKKLAMLIEQKRRAIVADNARTWQNTIDGMSKPVISARA